ncbi:MAG: type II secretion system protein [Betaproteobacteria bacterium]|nr:type II secretion system protein [Betaproteobacteria bacterium]
MGIALTVVTEVWQTVQKRDREEELLFAGDQIRRALAMHFADTSTYPHRLEDLLRDPAFPGVRRYLRKIYRDPMTGRAEWGLVKSVGDTIIGVHSLSDAQPFKKSGFSLDDRDFGRKKKYSDWVFVAKGVQGAPARPHQDPFAPRSTP